MSSNLPPFADLSDLLEVGASIPAGKDDVAARLLEDASAHIRDLIGQRVWPAGQSTITLWAGSGPQWLDIPLVPLISVDSVTVQDIPTFPSGDTSAVPAQVIQFDQSIRVCGPARVTVTATHGFSEPPADLVSWACVLASQALQVVTELGALGSGQVASVAIDDYRKSFVADGSARDPFGVPDRVVDRWRASFGGGAVVTESR